MSYNARYMRRWRAAKRAEKQDDDGYFISLIEMAWGCVSYEAANGQETSESEGMCYEDFVDITDSEFELTESDMKRNDSIKAEDIATWVHEFNIPLNALTKLLHILRKNKNFDFPLDARTTLNFPRKVDVISRCGGQQSCHCPACPAKMSCRKNAGHAGHFGRTLVRHSWFS